MRATIDAEDAPMIGPRTETCSLGEFTENSNELIRQLENTGEPIVLTVGGQPRLVLQDVAAYQRMLDGIDHLEAIDGIRRGLESSRRGEGRPADEVFEELRRKYIIPRDV